MSIKNVPAKKNLNSLSEDASTLDYIIMHVPDEKNNTGNVCIKSCVVLVVH